MTLHRATRLLAAAAVGLLGLTGCSSDTGERADAPAGDQATTPAEAAQSGDVPGGDFDAIVSLSPTATESLFAIGAGDQVIATDAYSYHPPEAPTVKELSGYDPNAESVLAFDPDLVIAPTAPEGFEDQLEDAGVELLVQPSATSIDEAYSQIEQLGAVTGHIAEAAEVVKDMRTGIDEAVASVPEEVKDAKLSHYHEVDPTFYSITDDTFLGEVYGLFGMTSIADDDGRSGGYPQLNPEAIIDANPQLIFLADAQANSPDGAGAEGGGVTEEDVAARPGWDTIAAVEAGNIFPLDKDLASRWGPRLPEFVKSIADALNKAKLPAGANS